LTEPFDTAEVNRLVLEARAIETELLVLEREGDRVDAKYRLARIRGDREAQQRAAEESRRLQHLFAHRAEMWERMTAALERCDMEAVREAAAAIRTSAEKEFLFREESGAQRGE
jgi:hypothetical protein